MKKAMLLLLTLLLCFPLQGSVSAAQNVQGQLISRLERVRERRPALPRTLEKNRQQRQETAQPEPERYYYPELALSRELQRYTYELCKEYAVDYELLLAMMWHESGFDVGAVRSYSSGMCDCGLLQINSINAEWLLDAYGIDDLFAPEQNIRAGVLILSDKVARYGEHGGLMAYNLGDGGYARAVRNGVTTNQYAELILETRAAYEQLERTA